eukprot:6474223-Amphidinium_carterae.2
MHREPTDSSHESSSRYMSLASHRKCHCGHTVVLSRAPVSSFSGHVVVFAFGICGFCARLWLCQSLSDISALSEHKTL